MGSRVAFDLPLEVLECVLSICTAEDAARLNCVCKSWRAAHVQATRRAWSNPPLDVMETILSRCSAADAARLRCVCMSWRASVQQATQFHVWGRAECSTRGVASPELLLNTQPLWSQRGGLMPAVVNPSMTQQASLVRCAKHLQASIADPQGQDLPLEEAMSLISHTLGDEVAHIVRTVKSCHNFSQHMVARSPGLQQAASMASCAAQAAQFFAAGAATVASGGGPVAAAAAAAAGAAMQAANATGTAAAEAHDVLAKLALVEPWGFWSALMLGMVCARDVRGVPSLVQALWSMTELPGHATSGPRISRAQVQELLSAVILLTRHRETGLSYAHQLKPVHDMLLASTMRLESIDGHRALAVMQNHRTLKGVVLPAPSFYLDTQDKPMTREQIDIVQKLLSPIKPLPNVEHRITAFAGSGKTHTLRQLAMAYPTLRILCTTFNKETDPLADEDNKGFPANVTRKTTHSIALRETGLGKVKKALGNPRKGPVKDWLAKLLRSLGLDHEATKLTHMVVDIVMNATKAWMASTDDVLTKEHVRQADVVELKNPSFRALDFVWLAKALYSAMLDPKCQEVIMPHNAYLKKFVLDGLKITSASGGPFDAILLDEAQDVNMATLQMLLSQPGTKVLCGDPNQHIYTFNYCCDTLSNTGPFRDPLPGLASAQGAAGGVVPSQQPAAQPPITQPPVQQQQLQQGSAVTPTSNLRALVQEQYSQGQSLTLTTSFRLGPEVAYVASRLLVDCCHDRRPLLGMGSADAVVFAPVVPAPQAPDRAVRQFRQMPLLSTRIKEGYPVEVPCIPVTSKALALWNKSRAPPQHSFRFTSANLLPRVPEFSPPALLPYSDAPLLYLARKNLRWFAAAVALAENGRKYYVDSQKFEELYNRIKCVEILCTTNEVEDKGLWNYHDDKGAYFSYLKLSSAAENNTIDEEWGQSFEVYQAWRGQTMQNLNYLGSFKVSRTQDAPFWLSTVHKVKGLEAPYVQLANDFLVKLSKPEERARQPDDETFLVYVAATRATKLLLINSELSWVNSPSVPQEPCPYLEAVGQQGDNETSTQLAPQVHLMSLLDMRQLQPHVLQAELQRHICN